MLSAARRSRGPWLGVLVVLLAGAIVSPSVAQQGRPEAQRSELGPEERRDLDRGLQEGR